MAGTYAIEIQNETTNVSRSESVCLCVSRKQECANVRGVFCVEVWFSADKSCFSCRAFAARGADKSNTAQSKLKRTHNPSNNLYQESRVSS